MARVEKPWGYYEDIFREEKIVFKKIVVNPGEELSLQFHKLRDEFWFIAEGKGQMTKGTHVYEIGAGETVFIQSIVVHSIKNTGVFPLEIYEMQCAARIHGSCHEDDIIRTKDKYGRD